MADPKLRIQSYCMDCLRSAGWYRGSAGCACGHRAHRYAWVFSIADDHGRPLITRAGPFPTWDAAATAAGDTWRELACLIGRPTTSADPTVFAAVRAAQAWRRSLDWEEVVLAVAAELGVRVS
uniref:hypothetical protein n=1 Tax=Pseudonocardia sp. CA-138482 TaxID=3240023 RepID=UPI003F497C82